MKKKCVQYYINELGFADFIRGCITLHQFCREYNYELFINNESHSALQFLEENEFFISKEIHEKIESFLFAGQDPQYVKKRFLDVFESGKDIFCSTNLNPKNKNGTWDEWFSWADLEEPEKEFGRKLLKPSKKILDRMSFVFDNVYKFSSKEQYVILHLRTGDEQLVNKEKQIFINPDLLEKIKEIIDSTDKKIILITDSSKIGTYLKSEFPKIHYWENEKTHTGSKKENLDQLRDTLCDFFTICGSSCIYYFSVYPHGSGFSEAPSKIFDIERHLISWEEKLLLNKSAIKSINLESF
jgi:hypothetical protein